MHAVQDHRQLACKRHAGLLVTAPLAKAFKDAKQTRRLWATSRTLVEGKSYMNMDLLKQQRMTA